MTTLLILAALIIWAIAYRTSIRKRPYTFCGHCQDGRVHGRVYRRAFAACRHCGGTGRKPRLGTRIFHPYD